MIDCNLRKNFGRNECKKSAGEGHFIMILPKGDNSLNRINPLEYKKYVNKINSHFGGSTTKPVTLGCWIDEERGGKMQCEQGLAVETFRDFDSKPELNKLDFEKRKKMLVEDFRFLNKIAKDSALEFGQASIPVIFDNISDVKLNEGKWKKQIEKIKLTGEKLESDWDKLI